MSGAIGCIHLRRDADGSCPECREATERMQRMVQEIPVARRLSPWEAADLRAALSASEARAADLDRKLTTAMRAGVAMSEAHEAALARVAASEARAKELERERDEARAESDIAHRVMEEEAHRAATAEARREEAERARGLAEHFRDSATAVLKDALDQRDAAARGRDEARRALRAVFPAGSWCAYCGQGIDEAEGHPCHQCSAARRVLSGAGAEEGR
jgi:hypothetical protein